MPQVIVDPDEVKHFNMYLSEAAKAIQGRRSALRESFDGLSEVWRDEKYTQFADVFDGAMGGIDQFLMQAEEYAVYLDRKVRPIYEYLGRPMGR
jgi:uncharacterized protein YukE